MNHTPTPAPPGLPSQGEPSGRARRRRGLHRFALLTVGATFLLLIAGALVTSNDAGLAVPDWPLSYGTWMPPMVGNIVYEHGHRLVATFVGLLTTILALWLFWKEPRRWVRRLGLGALLTVVAQGILGGITVLFLLPRPVSIAHASLAQIFFCLTVTLAVVTGPAWMTPATRRDDPERPALFHLSAAATAVVFLQLILGAAYRHNALGIVPHLLGATAVIFFGTWLTQRLRRGYNQEATLRRPGQVLVVLVPVQVLLGAAAYFARLAAAEAAQPGLALVLLTVAHVVVGAAILGACLVLTLHARRLLVPAPRALSLSPVSNKVSA
ncbi:MAG: COX15/CtaA family protein [Candidatus Acidiferrales bacterium]